MIRSGTAVAPNMAVVKAVKPIWSLTTPRLQQSVVHGLRLRASYCCSL